MYFKNIPNIFYNYDIKDEPVLKIVKDITHNVRFRKAILENLTLFDEYDMKDGETPEIIASKVYGNPEYHWVIMLCNQKYDYVEDFPMEYNVLNAYLRQKYGDTLSNIHHYIDNNGFIVNSDVQGAKAVTNYDYEIALNDSKRRIKLISPKLLATVLANFKDIV